ncbi:hypothetical protein DEU56DRAFT_909129 [Suillus clintonianus]|uniref:uncharacterized protein n=1 Tax=Suillus clintonianus TaxID=1904413 RepID=UPI001B8667DA|nr:uncharacterized protein DEU56DRAFT_909129 [Suillus clintonianus]KAG2148814.1 hypothetical protein DEU56DRAFT_909129 [Suillus clintonianus]
MAASSPFTGYHQVDSFCLDEEYLSEDDVFYVTLDLGAVEPTLLSSSSTFRLVGLDTPTPFLQLSGSFFTGQHDIQLRGKSHGRLGEDGSAPAGNDSKNVAPVEDAGHGLGRVIGSITGPQPRKRKQQLKNGKEKDDATSPDARAGDRYVQSQTGRPIFWGGLRLGSITLRLISPTADHVSGPGKICNQSSKHFPADGNLLRIQQYPYSLRSAVWPSASLLSARVKLQEPTPP